MVKSEQRINAVSDHPATESTVRLKRIKAFELVQPSGASGTTGVNSVTTSSAASLTLGTSVGTTGTSIDFLAMSGKAAHTLTGTNLIGNVGSVTTNV